jgi:hypothetical protein
MRARNADFPGHDLWHCNQPNIPGWGWMLKNGATTLWEHWAGSDNTYSNNHPMFGSVSQWFFNPLGGYDFVSALP